MPDTYKGTTVTFARTENYQPNSRRFFGRTRKTTAITTTVVATVATTTVTKTTTPTILITIIKSDLK